MVRVIIGAVPAALAMFVIGFLFFATGLQNIATGSLGDTQAAAVQQVLGSNLPGTGTFVVPNPNASSAQNVMYGQGPIATIHYNMSGFSALDPKSVVGGLVLNFIVALLIGTALIGVDRRVPDFGSRARVVVILAVAAAALCHLKEPLFYHHDWGNSIYAFIADSLALAAAGLIIARWFLPKGDSAPAATAG
ncbi:MAG TPA: hypothetical protein VEZ70_01950 [Allosphingosinicella sp.]|nr:hypothetical protein [Allosphingosinicella sp.]